MVQSAGAAGRNWVKALARQRAEPLSVSKTVAKTETTPALAKTATRLAKNPKSEMKLCVECCET